MTETKRKDEIVIRRVVGEGWYADVYSNGTFLVRKGPWKQKPRMPKVRSLKWKHGLGETILTEEE